MNFHEFQTHRAALRAARPDHLDAAETNLYRSLSHLVTPLAPPLGATTHRCHLASEWAALYGLPPAASPRSLISCGVRDSLQTIFRHLASTPSCRLWLPSDTYPVYHDLARAQGLKPLTFPTLPEAAWPDAPPSADPAATEWLLTTNPLKPRGRWLADADVATLTRWLAASPGRRLLIDAVYALDLHLHPSTQALLATEQALLLHSLTKGWLHPRLFGVTLVPAQDIPILTPLFRAASPPQESLAAARDLMRTHADTPSRVREAIESANDRMCAALLPILPDAPLTADAPTYLFPIPTPWERLLDHGILALPASTFGSDRSDLSILSSLSWATSTPPLAS
jgi:histidinol-phosphate/aromatic aminotransferase/cobyric acid decarboxylase-like protein